MTSLRPLTRRVALVVATAACALGLAACGSSDRSGDGSPAKPTASPSARVPSGGHNAADVAFAKGMIPHHRQAVEMAGLAATRASSPQVKEFAAQIKKAQTPEIRTLSGWLTAWHEPVPAQMPGMDHSAHADMPGMQGMEEMAALKKKSGRDFDRSFLEMMVGHHRGAVTMARAEQDKGAYGRAKTLAADIIRNQSAEITRMNKLLGKG
ncbi:DUF305 domain-containing protein [Streptomyces angustmyceticus]|uniref:DUF305 domain-containing protein n=1 Tax=Streptomyces angustmyceticus TaxID=285578 RepID=UPI003D8E3368